MPRVRAASASAPPWLPDECVTTPRAASPSDSDHTALQAPRNLKAPARCSGSHLKCSSQPASASSARERSTGVTWAWGAMRAAAASTSSKVGSVTGSMRYRKPFRKRNAAAGRIKHRFNARPRCWRGLPRGIPAMNRKLLLLPALSAALLAGCATYGYSSHGGGGYYYGQPGTEYHYYGYPSYYGYGSPYGYGYGYGAPYYWGGSIGYYYVPSWHGGHGHHHGDGHHHGGNDGGGHGNNPPPQGQQPDRPRPPWRDLDRVARPQSAPKMPP